ncbi:hypothetical protein BKA81DRAFT_228379 [Phyllosticta paracitricarpa]|uniref:Transmembrane protein n=1 Tax=Phyllosticta paracitricarpa TaxID=2016321 RepID=A0ABR1MVA3_9PEZI
MVLGEASLGGMPEGSIDSEQADNPPTQGYHFDLTKVPQPMGLPLVGGFHRLWWADLTTREIRQHTVHLAGLLSRPPTQTEWEAHAYHIADKNRIAVNGTQMGIYWGLWRSWATRKEYNWPFIQPYKKYADFNPKKFWWFEGQPALLLRHTARVGAWALFGGALGLFLFENYASIRAARQLMNDDRLKAVIEARKRNWAERQSSQAAGGSRLSAPPVKVEEENGSPTGESYSFSSSAGFGGEGQVSTRQASHWSTSPTSDPVPQDDASPTGSLGLWDDGSESASTESSWDRIRQQSASTRPTGQAPKATSSENDWISPEASSQQPQQNLGAWDRIRLQNQQGAPPQQKKDEDSWK